MKPKKRFHALLIITLIAIILIGSTLACPSDPEFRTSLKKGLFDYLSNPAKSKLTLDEIKDLMSFYISVPNVSEHDCAAIAGNESGIMLSALLTKTERIGNEVIPRCTDGTEYGTCSATKPTFCYSGMLRPMCFGPDHSSGTSDDCGCPTPYQMCASDGTCMAGTVHCITNADCGINASGQPFCENNSIYQTNIGFTCMNPGSVSSQCTYQNDTVLLQPCVNCVNGTCLP
jgi:hypothetical protein